MAKHLLDHAQFVIDKHIAGVALPWVQLLAAHTNEIEWPCDLIAAHVPRRDVAYTQSPKELAQRVDVALGGGMGSRFKAGLPAESHPILPGGDEEHGGKVHIH